jgi:hydrogenase maturation protease
VLVLGIGNLLWADEGFGVRAVEALAAGWQFPDHVRLLDGGTQGLYLLPDVQAADALLVFDAVDYGDTPGVLREIHGDDVPRFMGARKMSLHQTGFQEVLAAAALTGKLPATISLIGVQPENLEDFGGSLTPVVRAQIPMALEKALAWLRALGIRGEPRLTDDARTTEPAARGNRALELASYESSRPAPELAWRQGDARFLPWFRGQEPEAENI